MKIKKDIIYILTITLLLAACGQLYYTHHYLPYHETTVYYNQEHELNKEIINTIKNADTFVYFAIYTFTKTDIEDALLAAKYRGLEVVGITDTQQYSTLPAQKKIVDELRSHDIPVYEQNHTGIMHMKTVVTEKAYASGSYNWTASATNINDEVLEVSTNPTLRQEYQNILQTLFQKYGIQ
jgi:phosphatidylserine/phosphatidylglycerophosphate/cardiolipin synthase-like enzyme